MASSNIGVIHSEMPKQGIGMFVSLDFSVQYFAIHFPVFSPHCKSLQALKKKMCAVRMGCFYRRWGRFDCSHGIVLSIVDTFSMSLPLRKWGHWYLTLPIPCLTSDFDFFYSQQSTVEVYRLLTQSIVMLLYSDFLNQRFSWLGPSSGIYTGGVTQVMGNKISL